tara:strand:+ start:724 stop:1857 length:1134 start_codon:yes stop_codon:yes gene_type:complete
MFNLNRKFLLSTLANCLFFINFSSFFLLPLFLDNLDFQKYEIGILMGSFGISSIFLTPITSTLIDKYGKKLLGIIALFVMISTSLLFAFSESFYVFMILRIFQGASFSIFFNSSSALASDNLEESQRKRGLSIYYSSTIFPYFIGPYFGEYIIINFGYLYFFIFSAIFSILALIILYQVDDGEKLNMTRENINFNDFFKLVNDSNSKKLLITNFLSSTGFGVIMNFIAIFLKSKDLKAGIFFVIYSVTVTIFRLFLSDLFSEKNLFKKVLLMLALFSTSIFFMPLIDSILFIIIFSIIFSSTYALIYPFVSNLLVGPKSQSNSGRLFGALNATFGLGVHLMTFVFGYIIHIYDFNIGFKVASIFILLGTFLLYLKEK